MNKRNQIICAGILTLFPSLLLASEPKINIHVQLHVPTTVTTKIMAVGFSTGKTKRGSLGRTTTKTGPANATYSFGIQTVEGQKISCGERKLTQDSTVQLVFNGKTCHVKKILPFNK